ncbi:glutaredoxin-like YruB-family protein [Bacillus ectoiniformans]|uniref:glutaredoxin domain-containing protein n=1 Tax=Bacillus ectoiniformans TaxID=1494429 RepID=UPI001957B0A4|nr:glutaredoxin domain-containing protein [Bacillus ectoiniformans]MBM7647300.1 glutaredoxin-like YruB-family protein [Bacillus ectoiniformans]
MSAIVLYTQPECPPCQIIKLFLKDRGVLFEEKNIADDPKARNELINIWKSHSTPTVVIEEDIIRGFDLNKLTEILEKHQL